MFEQGDAITQALAKLRGGSLPDAGDYKGLPFPGREETDFVALDHNGRALVLVACKVVRGLAVRTSSRNLSMLPASVLTLKSGGQEVKGTYIGIRLDAARGDLEPAFALVCAGVLSSLSLDPDASEIQNVLEEIVQLFAAESRPEPAAVKGLWGELWTIDQSDNKAAWVAAWHARNSDKFDFGFAALNVEVKCSESQVPRHHFAADQLLHETSKTVIVSHLVIANTGGLSITDLSDSISSSLDFDLRLKLLRLIYRTVGVDLESTDDFRFSLRDRVKTVIRAEDVPTIPASVDPAIADVSFTVNLTDALDESGFGFEDLWPLAQPQGV